MPRSRSKYKLVANWIASIGHTNKAIQIRKYYSADELFEGFCEVTIDNPITTLKSFKVHLNKCIGVDSNLYKKEMPLDRYNPKYIILQKGEKFDNSLRISKRCSSTLSSYSSTKLKFLTNAPSSSTPSGTSSSTLSTTQSPSSSTLSTLPTQSDSSSTPSTLPTQSPSLSTPSLSTSNVITGSNVITHEFDHESMKMRSNIEHTLLSDEIKDLKKMDLPIALSFFMGNERARQIVEKDENYMDLNIKPRIRKYGNTIKDHLKKQILRLKQAYLTNDGWKNIIADYECTDEFSQYEIKTITNKAYYLYHLFKMFLQYYNSIRNIQAIANLAILQANKNFGVYSDVELEEQGNEVHYNIITHAHTLLLWFRTYRKFDNFPNNSKLKSQQDNTPMFLSENPDAVSQILAHCKETIEIMTVESVHFFIHHTVIPDIVQKIRKERDDESYSREDLCEEFRIGKLNLNTVWSWMDKLGFKHETRKKSYYVDNHEHPDNIKYRNEFIDRYLEYELRCYRWISITKRERDMMVENKEISEDLGYCYCCTLDGNELYEFHVDDHEIFSVKCSHLPYGGYLSVRMPSGAKPLMIVGQDECIFKQYVFTKGIWVLPDGTKQIIPKDEGQGLMISGMCSREIGYATKISKKVLKLVNRKERVSITKIVMLQFYAMAQV